MTGDVGSQSRMIALQAELPDRQLELIRDMAARIPQKRSFGRHPLTIRVTTGMIGLTARASRFPRSEPL